jgi:uncharacterized membrane protein
MSKKGPVLHRLNAVNKLIISTILGIATWLTTSLSSVQQPLHILLGWDIFCLSFLVLSWITFFSTHNHKDMRAEARIQNEKGIIVFVLALLATLAGFMAVFLLLISHKKNHTQLSFLLVTAFLGLMLSWTLVHTLFTTRYAYMYYADHKDNPETHAGGLEFPDEPHPGFLDFAYFSFVIGMTFQVSDVAVTSGKLRRIALLHSLLSFGFNTIIVALTINLIAGLS